jgi:hypothetical protein
MKHSRCKFSTTHINYSPFPSSNHTQEAFAFSLKAFAFSLKYFSFPLFSIPPKTRPPYQPINAAVAGYATAIWHAAITAVMAVT